MSNRQPFKNYDFVNSEKEKDCRQCDSPRLWAKFISCRFRKPRSSSCSFDPQNFQSLKPLIFLDFLCGCQIRTSFVPRDVWTFRGIFPLILLRKSWYLTSSYSHQRESHKSYLYRYQRILLKLFRISHQTELRQSHCERHWCVFWILRLIQVFLKAL